MADLTLNVIKDEDDAFVLESNNLKAYGSISDDKKVSVEWTYKDSNVIRFEKFKDGTLIETVRCGENTYMFGLMLDDFTNKLRTFCENKGLHLWSY